MIVGVGQTLRRPEDADGLGAASEPVDMMVDALQLAADDSGARGALLQAADSIRVLAVLSWRYGDPGAALAARLGATPAETVLTATGGNGPQTLVNDTALAIKRGDIRVALIAGGEAVYTRWRARRTKAWLDWSKQAPDVAPTRIVGSEQPGTNDAEMARSLVLPTQVYPIFETALRAAAGEKPDDHLRRISELWARFSQVASTNPYAWSPTPRTAEEIRTVTPDNRMIGYPYPKLMNSNIDTDQAAGLILCSVEAARQAGVPPDRWVFPCSGADAHDHWWVSERADLHSSPALRVAGRAALELAGVGIDDIAHVDLYSCFPSAVQVGAAELGLGAELDDWSRPLTVTGGLCFAGGPGNNYVTHAIAAMVDVLRADPGSLGLVTGVGWYLTKHAVGIYSTRPPAEEFRHAQHEVQSRVDALTRRGYTVDAEGPVEVEAYTVMHERDGSPVLGILACLLPDGRRTWANVRAPDVLEELTAEDHCGRVGQLHADGDLDLA